MPSLVLFGHRTLCAGDDLRIYAAFSILARLAEFSLVIALLARVDGYYESVDENLCDYDYRDDNKLVALTFSYLIISLVVSIVGYLMAQAIFVISSRGSPTQTEKRTGLKGLCHVHFTLLFLLQGFMFVCGIVVLIQTRRLCACSVSTSDCTTTTDSLYLTLIYLQTTEIALNILAILYFGCKIARRLPRGIGLEIASETKWRICCNCCCAVSSVLTCCLFGGKDAIMGDFTDFAVMLSDFFDYHGTLDLTPSDIVAGLIMVKRVQQQAREEYRLRLKQCAEELRERSQLQTSQQSENQSMEEVAALTNESGDFLKVQYRLKRHLGSEHIWEETESSLLLQENAADRRAIAEGARFMRLSLAIYGYIIYSINHPCTGFCEVSCLSVQRTMKQKKKTNSYASDVLNFTAFMKQAGVEDSEIVHVSFQDGVIASPYAVVLDHDWKSVVIVIRGTLSLDDALTDLTIRPESLEEAASRYGFQGCEGYVHSGILASAEWIYNDLSERKILVGLMNDANSKYSNYQLRVCGHSLGAGNAAVLAMLLRSEYPSLRGHCFSPPGCTLSETVAAEVSGYITSFVLDADIIPRASLSSLENLRYDIVNMIARIRVPKYKVMGPCGRKCGGNDEDAHTKNIRLLYAEDQIPDSDFMEQFGKYHELYKQRKEARNMPDVQLFPPGKIVHFVRTATHEKQSCLGKFTGKKAKGYIPQWADKFDFSEIILSSSILTDHDPGHFLKVLEDEAEKLGLSSPYILNAEDENHDGI